MFAELQHRTSNNLSVLASLLSMRRRTVTDPVARRALEEATARLGVVSRLSRQLHDLNDQEVDFGAFLRAVVPDVLEATGADGRVAVEVEVRADAVMVPASKAIPLGLALVELLSNALEHGFPGSGEGQVEVSLRRTGDLAARLLIRHDGVDLPPGFKLSQVRSLGLTVAKALVQQIGADLVMVQDRGVLTCVSFPLGDSPGVTQSRADDQSHKVPQASRAPGPNGSKLWRARSVAAQS
jgi:two-component sensor histidine kinase